MNRDLQISKGQRVRVLKFADSETRLIKDAVGDSILVFKEFPGDSQRLAFFHRETDPAGLGLGIDFGATIEMMPTVADAAKQFDVPPQVAGMRIEDNGHTVRVSNDGGPVRISNNIFGGDRIMEAQQRMIEQEMYERPYKGFIDHPWRFRGMLDQDSNGAVDRMSEEFRRYQYPQWMLSDKEEKSTWNVETLTMDTTFTAGEKVRFVSLVSREAPVYIRRWQENPDATYLATEESYRGRGERNVWFNFRRENGGPGLELYIGAKFIRLDKKDKTVELREAYKVMQAASGIEAGDRVKITRKAKSQEMGWPETWSSQMDQFVGKEFIVKAISSTNISLEGPLNRFPFFVMEITEKQAIKSVRLNENHVAKIDKDNKTVKVGCQTIPFDKIEEVYKLIK